MPTRAAMAAGGKPLLAYYHTIPLYTRLGATGPAANLLPSGNSGLYSSVGGRWRQIQFPIVDSTTTLTDTMRQQYMLMDVTNAANLGIEGFFYNVVADSLPGGTATWRWTEHMMMCYAAAKQYSDANTPGFKIAPCPTMLGVSNKTGTLADPIFWADQLAPILQHEVQYMFGGKAVLGLYRFDLMPPQWYTDFAARLLNTYGISIYCVVSYVGNNTADFTPYLPLFQSGVFGALHVWGVPAYTVAPASIFPAYRAWAATNGITYCCGIGPAWENDRPDPDIASLKQTEGYGVKVMQNQWESAILNNDSWVQLVSWNDHEEQHGIRPTTGYQWVPHDITAYYAARYRTGTYPTITRDAIYYHHRMMAGNVTYDPSMQTAGPYTFTVSQPVDKVIVTAFLTAPADVTITTGGVATTVTAPAGVSTLAAPFAANDIPTFRVVRGGVNVVPQFASAFPTRGPTVVWQDFLYRMGSSTRPPIADVQYTIPEDR